MNKQLALLVFGPLSLALSCSQVLGIHDTTSSQAHGGAGGTVHANAGGGAAGETAGYEPAGGFAGTGGAGSSAAGTSPRIDGGSAGLGGASSDTAGAPSAPESAGAGGDSSPALGGNGGNGGNGGETAAGGAPFDLSSTNQQIALWLAADTGVDTANGTVTQWRDQSFYGAGLYASPQDSTTAPTLVENAFGTHQALHFDGKDDQLMFPDADSVQLGTDSFVLELVLANESSKCCEQFVFMKQVQQAPYPGIAVCANWWVSQSDTTTPPPTTEFAALVGLSPDLVSTPFSDSASYNDGKLRVLGILRTSIALSIRVNGQVLGEVPSEDVNVSAAGQPITIGGYLMSTTLQFQGSIAEIVLARGLTTERALALDSLLVKKYAAVLTNP